MLGVRRCGAGWIAGRVVVRRRGEKWGTEIRDGHHASDPYTALYAAMIHRQPDGAAKLAEGARAALAGLRGAE